MARQLPAYVAPRCVDEFRQVAAANVADFCLEMYRRMGLLEGIRVARSGDPGGPPRSRATCPNSSWTCHTEGEIVRARFVDGALQLHEGGDSFVTLPPVHFDKSQISPARDSRLRWMQSVVHCTHYVAGRRGEGVPAQGGRPRGHLRGPRRHRPLR